MNDYNPLDFVPIQITQDFGTELFKGYANDNGIFNLVDIQRTEAAGFQGQRIAVTVVDENGFPLPNVRVVFSYSTGVQFTPPDNAQWMPPTPWRGHVVPTQGSGMIDQIQGDVIKEGQAGGVTVYILEPQFSSDVVSGCGMLADHTGLSLTFQLRRNGVRPLREIAADLERRMSALEGVIDAS